MAITITLVFDGQTIARLDELATALDVSRETLVQQTIENRIPTINPYLSSFGQLFGEWNSPEDAQAYDGL